MEQEKTWSIFDGLNTCQSIIDSEISMHSYQLARYLNDISIDLNWLNEWNDSIWGSKYFMIQDADLEQTPKTNVIKSVIDTLVSQVSVQKVRPYFSPVNGLFSTRSIVKQAQQFFDIIFDKEKVHKKITDAFRQSCIFGKGYVFYNPFTHTIDVPGSWQVGILSSETQYGKPTKLLVDYKNFPTSCLYMYDIKNTYGTKYVQLRLYIDTSYKKAYIFINGSSKPVKEVSYKSEQIPVITITYNEPIFGTRTISIVDELDGIQANIDLINRKISASVQLTPANTTYVEAGSSLKPSDISNKTGNVYSVKMGPGHTTLPVVNVTPAPVDPMWQGLLDAYIEKAYNMVGVSPLSSMSVKPAGVDSGVGLATLENIESERFQVQLDNYVHAFVDLANLIIDINDGDILPNSVDTSSYSWDDIRKQKDLFKVQFSAMSILSKNPQTRVQQIMQLTQLGLITADKIAVYLDSPDLEDAYKSASSISDAVSACIEKAVTKGEIDIPDYIGYQQLLTEIISTENKMYASSDDAVAMSNLRKLKDELLTRMSDEGFVDLSNESEEPLTTDEMSSVGVNNEELLEGQATTYGNPETYAPLQPEKPGTGGMEVANVQEPVGSPNTEGSEGLEV